jgi:hypothetical protein
VLRFEKLGERRGNEGVAQNSSERRPDSTVAGNTTGVDVSQHARTGEYALEFRDLRRGSKFGIGRLAVYIPDHRQSLSVEGAQDDPSDADVV